MKSFLTRTRNGPIDDIGHYPAWCFTGLVCDNNSSWDDYFIKKGLLVFFRNWSTPFCFVFIYACHVWGAVSILLYWTFRENMWVLPRDADKRVSGYCNGNLTFFHADFAKKEKIKTKQEQKHWLSSNMTALSRGCKWRMVETRTESTEKNKRKMVAKIMESRCVTFKLQELVRSYLWFKPDLVKGF